MEGASKGRAKNGYPNAFFTRCDVIGVSRSRTPASSATALAIAGATSGVRLHREAAEFRP
jgi:hypothetical protein